MSIGTEIPYRRSKRKDGQHTGSLVLDQHRKAATDPAEAEEDLRAAGGLTGEEAREKKIPVN